VPADLPSTQKIFFRLITAKERVEVALEEIGMSPGTLGELIRGDDKGSPVDRLDIYANMYFFRLHDVLSEIVPKLARLLGEGEFHNLCTDYFHAHLSASPNIGHCGRHLASYLETWAADRPWLSDLARLELARHEIFDWVDAESLTLDELRTLPPEAFAELALPLIAAHELVPVRFPVEELWQALREEVEELETPTESPRTLLVWRPGIDVRHRALDEREAELVSALAEGGLQFGHICDRIARYASEDEAPQVAFRHLGQWVTDGLIARRD
jgi:hypothetical protein